MEMSIDSRTIFRFAITGALIAGVVGAAFLAYLKTNPPNNWITVGAGLVAIGLCPRFIPFDSVAALEMEIPSRGISTTY